MGLASSVIRMDVVCGESVDGIHDNKACVCEVEGFPVPDKVGRDV